MPQLKEGWSRGCIGVLVSQKVPLSASFEQKFLDDAAAVNLGPLSAGRG